MKRKLCVVIFILVSDIEVRGGFVDIDLTYKKDYWLNIFMFCKLQHGQIEINWYLQISKACQVVECAFLDWCNLIRIQITAKYKIRTKDNNNLRPNKHKESRKTTSVYPEPTYRRTKIKERERENKRQAMVHIRN